MILKNTSTITEKMSATYSVLVVLVWVGLVSSFESFCPGPTSNGTWIEDTFKRRCILKCEEGYAPSGCYVLRPEGKAWNHDVPTCQEVWVLLSKSVFIVLGTGVVAVAAIPVVLYLLGFSAAGVMAGTIAANVQTASTAAGSLFAYLQSMGVIGAAATTKVAVGGVTGALAYFISYLYSKCEME